MKKIYCKNCGKKLSIKAWYYKSKRCKKCSKLGKLHFNWQGGIAEKNHKIYMKIFYRINKKRIQKYHKKYYQKYKKKIRLYCQNWRKQNPEKIRKYNNKTKTYRIIYAKVRIKKDIKFKLRHYLANKIRSALKNNTKSKNTLKLLGCTIPKLKQHLHKTFKKGMNWQNYGRGKNKWCIDHIIPCSAFDLSKKSEQLKCFNYKNLQALWFIDNIKKGNNFIKNKIKKG